MNESVPDRLYIEEKDREECYDLLRKQKAFEDKENLDMFMTAMIIGYSNKSRLPIKKRENFILTKYLSEDQLYVIYAIAIDETGDLSILLDKKETYKIAEEYANSGVRMLKDMVMGEDPGSFVQKLEAIIFDSSKKIEKAVGDGK